MTAVVVGHGRTEATGALALVVRWTEASQPVGAGRQRRHEKETNENRCQNRRGAPETH
jgi:hypothetical protein